MRKNDVDYESLSFSNELIQDEYGWVDKEGAFWDSHVEYVLSKQGFCGCVSEDALWHVLRGLKLIYIDILRRLKAGGILRSTIEAVNS